MPTISLAYAQPDAALAGRVRDDLTTAGYTVSEAVVPGAGSLLVLVHSASANADRAVQQKIIDALENHQHIIPLATDDAPLPRLINNLQPLDFGGGYPLGALKEQVEYLLSPSAPRPLTTLTPSVVARNRRAGAIVGGMALIVFLTALYAVGVLGLRRPDDDFDAVETQRVDQRNTIIAPTLEAFLPLTTEEAEGFPATVEALPTRLQPFIIGTATARAPQASQ